MTPRTDTGSATVAEAAAFEGWRAEETYFDDSPTLADAERDEMGWR